MKTPLVFARATSAPQIDASPSPAAIAAETRRSAAHQVAEARLKDLRERRAALDKEIEPLATEYRRASNGGDARRINVLLKQQREITAEIRPVHAEVLQHRRERAGRVASALSGVRIAAGQDLLAALAALQTAARVLDEVADAVERAGGIDVERLRLPDLGAVEASARRSAR